MAGLGQDLLARTIPQPAPEPIPEEQVETITANLPAVIPEQVESPWEGVPDWGQERFQALLFTLGGLTMALPLVELNAILEWPKDLTPLPNRSPWYLGLIQSRGQHVPVIDLAQLVVPERIRDRREPPKENQRRIIIIGDGLYGIACDSVEEVITLEPDAVKWRSSRTKRKWLAGTVKDQMCALLDADGLVYLLANGEEEPAE